jgi:hypothetical protein
MGQTFLKRWQRMVRGSVDNGSPQVIRRVFMDFSHIGVVATSLGVAMDVAKTMVGIRDSQLVGEKVGAITEQLLQAQQALLAHNASMFQLQGQYFEACEELRKLKEAAHERGRYSLVELAPGYFAYRVNLIPQESGSVEPGSAEPLHYLCQPCYDKGIKAVLNTAVEKVNRNYTQALVCPLCKHAVAKGS